ncbi:hypothetical protein J2Y63_004139 [Shinella sp. BE166]|uniref:hypothetical protein n=1 Tax=Shinella sp. BE166 TaxID=3373918 RepID=UPI003EBB41DD
MTITDREWELLKRHYGDLAYEEPHNHARYLAAIRAEQKNVAEGLGELDRGESVDVDDVVEKALAILDRAPDVPPEAGDELPETTKPAN